MGIEQHLVGLEQVGPDQEGPAVRELHVRHLKLGALPAQHRGILAPVELEGLAGRNVRGTNVPRPVVCCSRCRSVRHSRAKAATRL
jgi:hypothetical protein